jgi:hypothetical protein
MTYGYPDTQDLNTKGLIMEENTIFFEELVNNYGIKIKKITPFNPQ